MSPAEPTRGQSAPNSAASKVFISYSRKDQGFCDRLAEALDKSGFEPIYDRRRRQADPDLRLSAQDQWWVQLKTMIAACELMIFVVSPDSQASSVCDDEIAYAQRLGRRIIPIYYRNIDLNTAPERLRALNVLIDFRDEQRFAQSFDELGRELVTDIGWHRRGARLTRLAHQWDVEGRPEGALLRAGAIADAHSWIASRPADGLSAGPVVIEFLEASAAKEAADGARLRHALIEAYRHAANLACETNRFAAALKLVATCVVTLGKDAAQSTLLDLWPVTCRAILENRLLFTLAGQSQLGPAAGFEGDLLVIVDDTIRAFEIASWAPRPAPERRTITSRRAQRAQQDFTAKIFGLKQSPAARRIQSRLLPKVGPHGDREPSTRGDSLAVIGLDGETSIWDVKSLKKLATLSHPVSCCAWSPSDEILATAREDGVVSLWRPRTGELLLSLADHNSRVAGLHFSSDGRFLLGVSNEGVWVWDAWISRRIHKGAAQAPGRPRLRAQLQMHEVQDATADGARVAVLTSESKLTVLDARTGAPVYALERANDTFTGAQFDRAGRRVITSFLSGAVVLWDASSAKPLLEIDAHKSSLESNLVTQITSASFSPDELRLLTYAYDGTACVWDAATGALLLRFTHPAPGGVRHSNMVIGAEWDGDVLTTLVRDQTLFQWDVTGTDLVAFHPLAVLAAALSHGRGELAPSDRKNPLLSSAPSNLEELLGSWVGDAKEIDLAAARLSRRLHPSCYTV